MAIEVGQGFNTPELSLGEWEIGRDLKIDHIIRLVTSDGEEWVRIKNKEAVPWQTKTDSTWAIATATTRDITSINDYFESSRSTLYYLGFGVYSDVEIDVIIRMTGTTGEVGGIKQNPTAKFNPTTAPYMNPRFVIKSYGKYAIPSFKLENNTKQTAQLVKLSYMGWKFGIEPCEKPNDGRYTTISLRHIGEVGKA
ncbi:MAG: hypothetical protein UY48_C0011G0003 [Candidatus Gottesmanbacteria bacterium GW2011_GWB1_49_7]|uniref:Uncharacterized protein n=1 Tax=Candidatus Gottesmanbacteria bacterium GW2011_GWB1_49_7 TaxID=1618448 RepID=A0A0G1W1D5_9BACT|nr:MAG: hypothetical protein UY48_C0011G0003 [Candidatus Gottesmanbacteria bacterium GW2011_GWB1_49_7]